MIWKTMKDTSITLTWDIGHSHSASNIDEKYIMQNECKLKHFHIHGAIGNCGLRQLKAIVVILLSN